MWIVELVRQPKSNDYPYKFFPKKFHYKKDALELVREVENKGGQAILIHKNDWKNHG